MWATKSNLDIRHVMGGVVEEASCEGDVAGLIPSRRIAHEFCAKNVKTCLEKSFDGDEGVRRLLSIIIVLLFLKRILCYPEIICTHGFITSTASENRFPLTIFLAQPLVEINFH